MALNVFKSFMNRFKPFLVGPLVGWLDGHVRLLVRPSIDPSVHHTVVFKGFFFTLF